VLPPSPMEPAVKKKIDEQRKRFVLCYAQGLSIDPASKGSVAIVFSVRPNGEVGDARLDKVVGLTPSVAACLLRGVQHISFDERKEAKTFLVPLSFTPADVPKPSANTR
jgi:hypothetical protein